MAIQLQQSGVIIKSAQAMLTLGAASVSPAAAGVVVLGPRILAQIFTSEQATKALLLGLHAKPGTAGAKRVVGTLSNFLNPGRRQSQEPTKSELAQMFDFKEDNR